MKTAVGTPTGSRSGRGTVDSNAVTASVGERSDRPAGETRHPLGRLHATAGHETTDGVERVVRPDGLDRQVGREDRLGHGSGLDAGEAVAHLEQPARPDAEERIPPETLAALDRFEEVRRAAVVEPKEGADGRLEVGRARGAQEDRVGVGVKALCLRQADRIVCRHRVWAS